MDHNRIDRRSCTVSRWRAVSVACVGAAAVLLATPASAQQRLPDKLETYFASTGVTPQQRRDLLAGRPITVLLDGDASKEVAVLGAIWIEAPIARYVEAVKDIEAFERGGAFRITKKVSMPPRLEDFAAMELPNDDLVDLRTCRVGNCALKLGKHSLERIQTEIDWRAASAPRAVNGLMRELAVDYVTRYLEGGNAQLAVYRDTARPTFVAQELRGMIDGMPELSTYMPKLRRYLLDFPGATLPDATSFVYWQEARFGLKPTIRISHLTIADNPEGTVVASKMLYASHYFWTGLEIRVLVPDPSRGAGFWFVTVNRSRSDGLSGFTGMFVRRRAKAEVEKGTLAGLRSTKQRLEAKR